MRKRQDGPDILGPAPPPPDPRRHVLWSTLWTESLRSYVAPESTVVELGAGRCDLINVVDARRRIAVDVWEGVRLSAARGVETHVGPAQDLHFLSDHCVDVVFASNLLEHLEHSDVESAIRETRRILRPGGRLVLIQPNFRLCPRRYFDDYRHRSIWTDQGLASLLMDMGFEIDRVVPRFLPLTLSGSLPVRSSLIRAYLRSPLKPGAGQMLITATTPAYEPGSA